MPSLHPENSQRPDSAHLHGYEFDSQASPQQKREAALKAVPVGLKTEKRNRGEEIISDLSSRQSIDMPAASSVGAAEQAHESKAQELARQGGASAKIGWEMAGGSSRAEYAQFQKSEENAGGLTEKISSADAMHQTALESHLPDSAFGEWYHNTGIIIFCGLTSWLLGRLGAGLSSIILVLAVCGTYYRTSVRRVRRNVRDDVTRQLAKAKLETDAESAEWMNSFLTKFWIIYEPVLSATIVASVDQVLATTTPAFLESMRLAFFTLGTKPPRIEEVKTYPKTEDDIVLMEWRFSFTPNDTDDMTARQLRNKINPKIELAIRAGVSIAAVNVPIVVEDIAFSGLMQVRIKLMTDFPHIKVVDLSFLEKPEIGYVLKPIGGSSLGFDIGFIPGLSGWILEMIHATLAPMMYAPNVFTLDIQQMLSGAPIDSAIGVAVVTIHSAHGLRNPDIGSGTPDPYVSLNVGHGEVARTEMIKSTTEPRFNESKTLLLTTLNDPLSFEIFDYNEVRKDKSLGIANFDLKQLENDSEQEHLNEVIMANGKPRGNINFSIAWYPVLTAPQLEDGSLGEVPESKAGIVRFTVHQAKNLGGGKNVSPQALLTVDAKEVSKTAKMKHTHNPVWDFSKEILVTDKSRCTLGVLIKDDGDSLGSFSIKLTDLLKNTEDEIDDYVLQRSADPTSKVKLSAVWKPVAMTGSIGGKAYAPPIGALRLDFKKATGLRNPEIGLTGGKADPYMRVLVNGQQRARTVTIKNDQNPEWNEVVYVPIRSPTEKVVLEVMDYQARTKDRSLGSIELSLTKTLTQDGDGRFLEYTEQSLRRTGFMGRDARGELEYQLSFHPALNVMSPEDLEDEQNALAQATESSVVPALPSTFAPLAANGQTTSSITTNLNGVRKSLELNPGNNHQRTTSTATANSRRNLGGPKIRITKDDLVHYNSGFLAFELLEGQLPTAGCYLQVIFDDYLYPAYTTSRSRSKHVKWNETGDGFVRELDMSRVTVRLNKEEHSTEEDNILASSQNETLDILRRSLNETVTQNLRSADGQTYQITFRCHYYPVPLTLDPRESINNMGNLNVTVLSGSKLCAADRGNKSDPYVKFYISTQKEHVYQTQTIKKTLNPTWNESFEVPISSRLENIFELKVFDWDAVGNDDDLGTARISLANIEPMTSQILDVPLLGPKGGDGKSGTIQLRLLFKPNFIKRARRGSTTRALTMATGVAGAPVKVVGSGFSKGVSGVKKTGSFLGRGIGGVSRQVSKGHDADIIVQPDNSVRVQDGNPPGSAGSHQTMEPSFVLQSSEDGGRIGQISTPVNSIPVNSSTLSPKDPSQEGFLSLRLQSGEHFPTDKKMYVKVKTSSGKIVARTDATKHINPSINFESKIPGTPHDNLQFSIWEHHTLGTDKLYLAKNVSLSPQNTNGQNFSIQFDEKTSIFLSIQFIQTDVASQTSHRGSKLGSPFRKSTSQR